MPQKLNLVLAALIYALVAIGHGHCTELNTGTKSSRIKHVMEMSMDDRVGGSSLNRPLKEDSIVFPHTNAGKVLPNPVIVSAGSLPVSYPDVDRVVWTAYPKDDRYVEYLSKRETFLKAGDDLTLINWCEENNLPIAAEFELRRVLRQLRDFRKQEYQRFLTMWIKYADKRQTEYSFPLPVDGEWFVFPDKTGHHRTRHFAAYAVDLIIMEAGKTYRRSGLRLEDYYCWGRPILAQADGIVIRAEDGNPDATVGHPGEFDRANFVEVYYGGGIGGLYVHIQKSSLKVKVGQRINKGDVLALIGNSGASGKPHLHFTMRDMSSFSVRGLFSFQSKKGKNWIDVNGQNLVEDMYIQHWNPELEGKQAQPNTPMDADKPRR